MRFQLNRYLFENTFTLFILYAHPHPNYLKENWCNLGCSNNRGRFDEVLRISNNQGVFAGILDVKIQVVDDGSALLVGFEPTLATKKCKYKLIIKVS